MDPEHTKRHACDLPQTSNEPIVMDTGLLSPNQHQSMDKPPKQPKLDLDITKTTTADSNIETIETALVQAVYETEYLIILMLLL